MAETFKGESLAPAQIVEKEFGPQVADTVRRLQEIAKGKDFESLMLTLQRMMASDGIEMSEEQFESLKSVLSDNKRELGLDGE